jgi:hypothetical protein
MLQTHAVALFIFRLSNLHFRHLRMTFCQTSLQQHEDMYEISATEHLPLQHSQKGIRLPSASYTQLFKSLAKRLSRVLP